MASKSGDASELHEPVSDHESLQGQTIVVGKVMRVLESQGEIIVELQPGLESPITISEHNALIARNAELEAVIEKLQEDQQSCKDLLFENHKSHSKPSPELKGYDNPVSFPSDSDQLVQVIAALLKHKDTAYEELSARYSELESKFAEERKRALDFARLAKKYKQEAIARRGDIATLGKKIRSLALGEHTPDSEPSQDTQG